MTTQNKQIKNIKVNIEFNWKVGIDGNEGYKTHSSLKNTLNDIKSTYGKLRNDIIISKTVREEFSILEVMRTNGMIK